MMKSSKHKIRFHGGSLKKQQGMIFIAALLVALPLLALGGIAITVSAIFAKQIQLGNASEVATMYIASREDPPNGTTLSAATAIIQQFNGLGDISSDSVHISNDNGVVQLSISTQSEHFLLSDQEPITIKGSTTVETDINQQNLELSIIMDYSGSMWGETDEMQATLAQLTNLLTIENDLYQQAKIAITPFSDGITLSLTNGYSEQSNHCFEYLTSSSGDRWNSDYPWISQYLNYAQLQQTVDSHLELESTENGCSGPNAARILLTDDRHIIDQAIIDAGKSNAPSGGTSIDQGLLWGLRMLTPQWQEYQAFNQADLPSEFLDTKTQKVVLLISDGDPGGSTPWCKLIKEESRYSTGGYDICRLDELPLCSYIKETLDIRIVSLYFPNSYSDPTAEQNMRFCASYGDFYTANYANDLKGVFKKIIDDLNNKRTLVLIP
jgi:Flp pilus assembly protein TadG